ncbi:ATP-binding protein [Kitasatospora sp. NPDC005856]|uniref:ATP-binding protein n=1 Tax=Kitasatospora sp. NPDC005856 TaxID=3154566 RepID=UPI0033C8A2C1
MDFLDRKATYGSGASEPSTSSFTRAVTVLVVGGTGVGKTALIDSVSDVRPMVLKETVPRAGEQPPGSAEFVRPARHSVAVDFGRTAIDEETLLFLFCICEKDRATSLWDDLCEGAVGAIALVDARRMNAGQEAVVALSERGLPYLVAVNVFPGTAVPSVMDVRSALDLSAEIPVVVVDARLRRFAKAALLALIHHVYRGKCGTGGLHSRGPTCGQPAQRRATDEVQRGPQRLGE